MFGTLLHFYRNNSRRYFARNKGAKLVTMIGFFVVLAFLIVVMYIGFYFGFKYISHDTFFSEVLTLYIVELFLLVSLLLVFTSALLSGVTQLFRTGNNSFVMASPHYDLKPTLVLTRMVVTSLWPLLVIIIPALVALRQVFGLPLTGFVIALLSTIALVVFGVLAAILLIFVLGISLRKFGVFSRRHLIEVTLLSLVYLIGYIWSQFRSVDLVKFFQARLTDLGTPDLAPILSQFHYFPSHFSALAVYYGMHVANLSALAGLMVLSVLSGIFYACYALFRGSHLYLWQKSEEKGASGIRALAFITRNMLRHAKGAERVILKKEIVLFMRDARGMLWISFMLLIWVIQIASSHLLVRGLSAERVSTTDVPGFVGLLQFATVIYFIALFVLRFAFPTFSMERKTSWIIRMSPVDMREVFAAKLVFFVMLFGAIALFFSLGSAVTVGLAIPLGVPLILGVLIATFFLTALGLMLGARYPDKETDDPEQLSTSMPGIGFILISLCYGLFGAFAISHLSRAWGTALYAGFIIMSVLLTLLFVRIARFALATIGMN